MNTMTRAITLAALISAGLAWSAPESADETSYAAGYGEGVHWVRTQAGLDSTAYLHGIKDGLAAAPEQYALTGAVVEAAMKIFTPVMMARTQTNHIARAGAPIVTGRDAEVVGYALGYALGNALRVRGVKLDVAAYARGLADSIQETPPAIGTNRLDQALQTFHRTLAAPPAGAATPPPAGAPPPAAAPGT